MKRLADLLRDPQFRSDVGNNARDFFQSASNTAASNVTAPIDGLAWLLRKAGVPVPQAPIGGSDWAQNAGLMAEPKNKNSLASLLGEAAGNIAPIAGYAKAPQIAGGLLKADEALQGPASRMVDKYMDKIGGKLNATVYHGSPHKFDAFDASKIGTGEGAQAYGHGLYLAESPDVARSYTASTNHVAKQDWVQLDGVPYRATQTRAEDTAHNVAADALSRFDYDKKAAMGWLENYGKDLEAKKIIKGTKKFGPTNDPATSLYKVDLPDNAIAKMLDWDKPLSQQAPEVQANVGKVARFTQHERDNMPIRNVLEMIGSPSDYSAKMRQAGIPGIRYLDGGSRSAGQGSSNYVVFPGNESLLKILSRNGQNLP